MSKNFQFSLARSDSQLFFICTFCKSFQFSLARSGRGWRICFWCAVVFSFQFSLARSDRLPDLYMVEITYLSILSCEIRASTRHWWWCASSYTFNSLLRDQLILRCLLEFWLIFQFSLARSADATIATVAHIALSILSCEIRVRSYILSLRAILYFQFSLARSDIHQHIPTPPAKSQLSILSCEISWQDSGR